MEPGRYFLAPAERFGERSRGPHGSGDLFGVDPELPLRLKAGTAGDADFEWWKSHSPERMARFTTRFATLSGLVTDAEGRPVAGFRVCLYNTPRIFDEPLEVSDPTGEDGRFLLSSTRDRRFRLGAREKLGGPPGSGERVGFPARAGGVLDSPPASKRRPPPGPPTCAVMNPQHLPLLGFFLPAVLRRLRRDAFPRMSRKPRRRT